MALKLDFFSFEFSCVVRVNVSSHKQYYQKACHAIDDKLSIQGISTKRNCQTPGLVFRLGVDFVLPLSQEEEQEEQEQEPLTKIYQKGMY